MEVQQAVRLVSGFPENILQTGEISECGCYS
jgi:hypothetical protein